VDKWIRRCPERCMLAFLTPGVPFALTKSSASALEKFDKQAFLVLK